MCLEQRILDFTNRYFQDQSISLTECKQGSNWAALLCVTTPPSLNPAIPANTLSWRPVFMIFKSCGDTEILSLLPNLHRYSCIDNILYSIILFNNISHSIDALKLKMFI